MKNKINIVFTICGELGLNIQHINAPCVIIMSSSMTFIGREGRRERERGRRGEGVRGMSYIY